jgi:DNA-binding LacI/PurR family transcriptional regulator
VTSPRSPMRGTPRMADIAERAGVSRMAVSAVLMGTGSGRIGVSATTAERIRQIAEELGYRPNAAARQLAGKRSGVIAVVAHDWKNFLAQRVLAWLHEAAEKQGFRILATQAPSGLEPIEQLLRDVQAGWIDGIVYLAHENEPQWTSAANILVQTSAVVAVVGDMRIPGFSSVVSDVKSGARASIAHLRERKRTCPVLITEEIETTSIRTRIDEYCTAANEYGVNFDRQRVHQETRGWLVSNPDFYPQFEQLAKTILKTFRADSVLCDTDFTAVGLLRAFRRLGLRIPEDIAVIGWGDLQFAAIFDPRITTVTHQLPELLTHVVTQLQSQIESGTPGDIIQLVDTQLLVRETT